MSLILANASRLKPEVRLAQAISQFEADLSGEQKGTFRNNRAQSCASPPDPSDVMRLTADIDRKASGKVGGRCYGPRFTNFLQVVQQFAALGDVVIGGSQNIIACGVWSLVRMSLLSIVNYSSYLDKLSTLFMNAGRSAPRYQAMALLYPRSKSLQSNVFEYFIVVVRLCHQLLKYTQKSTLQRAVSTLSDSDVKTFQSELDLWANSIKEEMNLLMAKNIEEEAQKNSKSRGLLSKYSKSASHQQKMATKLRVLDFLSKYDNETAWKQTRKVGNATIFAQAAKYQEWKSQANSCTLVYTGKLGSGKSVLLANIVDDLHVQARSKNTTVAYFFCRHDIPESLKAQTIISSLARQLLCTIPDLTGVAKLCGETSTALDFEKLLSLLHHALPSDFKAYFVLDGLDECVHSERDGLAQQLRKLQDTLQLLLCISYRVEPKSGLELRPEQFVAANIISIPDDNPDIEAFIEAELEGCLTSRKLILRDPALILEIQDALLNGSQGMFLWVVLQIQSLCTVRTDQGIKDALADLPKDLSETFSRILRRSEDLGKSYQRRILELVTVSCRPLTVDELGEALSVVPGDAVWNSSRLLNDVSSALASCGCLVTVDEEESTVRFVHHSVKQFLIRDSPDSTRGVFTFGIAQRTMADILVTYLSYGIFGTEVSTTVIPHIEMGSAPSRIIRSTLDSSSKRQTLALKLLKSRKQPDFDISNTLAEARKPFSSFSLAQFPFYYYARLHWLHHMVYVSGQEPVIYNLLCKLLQGNLLNPNATGEDHWIPQTWVGVNETVLELLFNYGKVDPNLKDTSGRTMLFQAALSGHSATVDRLLSRYMVQSSVTDNSGRTPLWIAAANGHVTVVKLLLQWEDSGNIIDSEADVGQTPLWVAAKMGHSEVVKMLVQDSRVNVDKTNIYNNRITEYEVPNIGSVDHRGQTPLLVAARNGHCEVVKLLLETNKADVNAKDYYERTPLLLAAGNQHRAVVKMLLETGEIDYNLMCGGGKTQGEKFMDTVRRTLAQLSARNLDLNYERWKEWKEIADMTRRAAGQRSWSLLASDDFDLNSERRTKEKDFADLKRWAPVRSNSVPPRGHMEE